MKLVSYWRNWYRLHSVQGAVGIIVMCAIKAASLVILFPFLSWAWTATIIAIAAALLAIGALTDQPTLDRPKPTTPPSNAGKATM